MELAKIKQNTWVIETRIWVQIHNSWQSWDENSLILKWIGPEKEEGIDVI